MSLGEVLVAEEARFEKEPWRLEAACKTYDPDLFFPVTSGGHTITFAKSICKRCPSRTPCFEYAWENSLPGIWGGTDEWERLRMITLLGPNLPR